MKMNHFVKINEKISIEFVDDIALVLIDSPPVNALGADVRLGLMQAIEHLNAEGQVKAIAIYCAGRTFVAGADISEFGKPRVPPSLPEVLTAVEQSAIPVLSVLHGTVLGGGLELAMATHARIGVLGVRVGLPEILLGLIPGAGGTQRLPRLAGLSHALEMILSGRHVPGDEAVAMGVIDRMVSIVPRDAALDAARSVLDGSLITRRTGELVTWPDPEAIEKMAAKMKATQPLLVAPHKAIEAVAASTGPLLDGIAIERRCFEYCMETPQRDGLIHAFFAERAVADIPEKTAQPHTVGSIGVIGGGTMGSGIATAALMAGFAVILVETSEDALNRGIETIASNVDGAVKRNKISAEDGVAMFAMLQSSTDIALLAEADFIIEAVFENMDVKKALFGNLDTIARPGAILATNTSYLDINEIAASTGRPDYVIGAHFFSPAHVMRLMEIVIADKTAPEAVATAFALAKRMKKIAVRARVCDGFIGNRILAHYRLCAHYMMIDGALPQQIDDALEAFGFAMGPFRVSDLSGLDVSWAERKRKAASRPPEERYISIADMLCEQGWFGRKSGRGFYDYRDATPQPHIAALEIIEAERARLGIKLRSFTNEEIVDRYMTAMISEAARVVEDGIALRPIDIDAVLLFGYGFPRFRGGPLHYADTLGATEIMRRIREYAVEDAFYWQVPKILVTMADEGVSFADLNKKGKSGS